MDKRNWRLKIGIDTHRITEEEARTYLQAVQNGEKYFAFKNELVVTTNFQELCPLSVLEADKQLEEGKWQCDNGKWHNKGASCFCEKDYKIVDGVARLVDKN